ncbi:MAG TPA: aspartyl/asparaginyl beta-hydroxylase domain-containing protein [Gemmataceae bacterium]|nr:aspartyl/asparaginyl beta-hydroxylase domain-containing protein [Gemmataceae bacterium]
MPPFAKLPLAFDPARLAADLGRVAPEEWQPHYNRDDHEGEWAGVALRSAGGATGALYAAPPSDAPFADTPLLGRCPYFREVLSHFQCPLRSVRLLRLRPGARIREHRDPALSPDDGEVRLHVPVTTNLAVEFVVNGEKLRLAPGEVWYVNFSLPHRVANRGATDRVHLVIDCVVNDWLRQRLPDPACDPPAAPPPDLPRSPENLERFRRLVEEDAALAEELWDIGDRQLFLERVVRLGEARGLGFTAAHVEEALRTARRAWLERGIQ